MGREVKRVPLDFDYPVGKTWIGYAIGCYYDTTEEMQESFGKTVGEEYWEYFSKLEVDVPKGDGWQMWETVSEGSPMSPVFKTPEELAQWLADNNASAFGSQTATYEQWLNMIKAGWAPCGIYTAKTGLISGVEGISLDEQESK